ncbi:MAG: hypothetical protein GY742_09250 [Hyphomicrobiales bacterium]|nr:hypothetical protein [Hyphomicrobiales bacterium]
MKRTHTSAILALVLVTTCSVEVFANADRVFAKLDGNFRGSGSSITDSSGKKRRVSCQLANTYDKKSGKLKMLGKCASSQGSSRVRGTITHKNGNVTGTYISLRANVDMTKSTGKSGSNSLTIYSSFIDRSNGELYEIKQILQLTRAGFQANFFAFDKKSKKYESAGVLSFRRK